MQVGTAIGPRHPRQQVIDLGLRRGGDGRAGLALGAGRDDAALLQHVFAHAQARAGLLLIADQRQVRVEQVVRGVALADGSEISARCVVSNLNPKLLYLQLIEARELDDDFVARMRNFRCESATFRINVALSELPDFSAQRGTTLQPHHQAGIIMAPSLAYMERAYFDARTHGWSRQPIVEMLIPSTVDDTLAPAGKHVASLFCQHFAFALPGGKNWDDSRDEAADLVIDTVNHHAPNFKASILGRRVLSPLDLEREFGLIGGDIFHGALSLDQLYSARPLLGHADYRGPLARLYMCGSGTHPGGGVTGLPGHNAAREIVRDWRRGRLGA